MNVTMIIIIICTSMRNGGIFSTTVQEHIWWCPIVASWTKPSGDMYFFFWSVKNSFPVSRFSSSSRDILKGINLFGGLELKIVFIYKNIKTDIFIAYFSRYHLHRAIDKVITVFITLWWWIIRVFWRKRSHDGANW